MGRVKVVMNSAGARELMNSSAMQSELMSHADAICSRANSKANGGYAADVQAGVNRAHARVTAVSEHARKMEYNHNVLLKSI